MPNFIDADGKTWPVEFDAFVLEEIHRETGVDLADIVAGGWESLENERTLVRVMAVVCGQPFRDFAKLIRQEAIGRAKAALEAAAADFFQATKWSAMQSTLEKQKKQMEILQSGKEFREAWAELGPIIAAIKTMPPEMKEAAMDEVRKKIRDAGGDDSTLQTLEEFASATGPDSTPSKPVTDSPGKSESAPAD